MQSREEVGKAGVQEIGHVDVICGGVNVQGCETTGASSLVKMSAGFSDEGTYAMCTIMGREMLNL